MSATHSARPLIGRLAKTAIPVVAVLLVTAGIARAVSSDDGDVLKVDADFKDASPLITGNDVRLNGVKVGTIDRIRVVNGGARLSLELDPEALPVYADAKLSSRPVSLLGERYLDLDPGTDQAKPLREGAVLPQSQTGSATDLDEVLNVLDKPTSQSLAALVTTLGVGLDGNGKDVAAAVKALAPAMRDTSKLSGVLKDQNQVLASLVDSLEPVARGLAADDGSALDSLVDSANRMLDSTATNEVAFRTMLKELPGTLTSARTTLQELQGTAESATPTVKALRPTTKNLTAISKELQSFADSADPALRSANPVLEKAEKLIEEATPVADRLREQGPDITSTARSLRPLTKQLGGSDFTTVMEFFKGWALATNGRDGLAHYFRAGTVITPYTVTGLIPSLDGNRPLNLTDPTADEPSKNGAPNTDEKAEAAAASEAARSVTDGLGGVLDNLLPGLLSPRPTSDGGVTGLNEKQERGVLGFLLGGS